MAYINDNNVIIKTLFTNQYFLSLYNIANISDFYNWFDDNENEPLLTKTRIFETCLVEFYSKTNDKIILSIPMNKYINDKSHEITIMLFPYFSKKYNNMNDYLKFATSVKVNNNEMVNSYIKYLYDNIKQKSFQRHKLSFQYFLIIYLGKKIDIKTN